MDRLQNFLCQVATVPENRRNIGGIFCENLDEAKAMQTRMQTDFSEALELMNRIPRIIEKKNSEILLTLVFPDCSEARKNDAKEQQAIWDAKNRKESEKRKKDALQNTEIWREYFQSLDDLDRDPENPEYQNNFSFWEKQVYPRG